MALRSSRPRRVAPRILDGQLPHSNAQRSSKQRSSPQKLGQTGPDAKQTQEVLLAAMSEQNAAKLSYILPFARQWSILEATLGQQLLDFLHEKERWHQCRPLSADLFDDEPIPVSAQSSSAGARDGQERAKNQVKEQVDTLRARSSYEPSAEMAETQRLEAEVRSLMPAAPQERLSGVVEPDSVESPQSMQDTLREVEQAQQPNVDATLAANVESQTNSLLQALPVIRTKLVAVEERLEKVESADKKADEKRFKELMAEARAAYEGKEREQESQLKGWVKTHVLEALAEVRQEVQEQKVWLASELEKRGHAQVEHDTSAAAGEQSQGSEQGLTLAGFEARLAEQKTWLVAELSKHGQTLTESKNSQEEKIELQVKSMEQMQKTFEEQLQSRTEEQRTWLATELAKQSNVSLAPLDARGSASNGPLEQQVAQLSNSLSEYKAFMMKELVDKFTDQDSKHNALKKQVAKLTEAWENEKGPLEPPATEEHEDHMPPPPKAPEFTRADVSFARDEALGEGAHAKVYKGILKAEGNRAVAIKEYFGQEGLEASEVEAECLARFQHPNLVQLIGVVCDEESNLLILEQLQPGDWPSMDHAGVIRDLLTAVEYIHSFKLVHLDIKPDNVMCDASTGSLKLIDFSVGRRADMAHHGFIGSLPFAAPELLDTKPWEPKAVDVYAVGVFGCFIINLQGLFKHLGFALQLNDADADTRSAALPQLQAAAAALAQDLRNVSGPGGDLTAKLIASDPLLRPTAEEALGHIWLEAGSF